MPRLPAPRLPAPRSPVPCAAPRRASPSRGGVAGQASVELVALLPLCAVAAALLWQAIVAGQAAWLAGGAARAAARAHAVGGDPSAAVRAALPARLRHGLRLATADDGAVTLRVHVPLVVGRGHVATLTSRAALPGQR